jgi:hypothetical protein
MTADNSVSTRPVNPPAGGKTYARTLKDQQTFHGLINAVIDIPAGTRVEVMATTDDKFFGMYREGAADCIVQGDISDFEACPPETPAEFKARGLAAITYLNGVVGEPFTPDIGLEQQWAEMSVTEREYSIGAAARMKIRSAQRDENAQ